MKRKGNGSGKGPTSQLPVVRRRAVRVPVATRRSSFVNGRSAAWVGGADALGWLDDGFTIGAGADLQPGSYGNQTPNSNLGTIHRMIKVQRDLVSFAPTLKNAIEIFKDEALGKTGVIPNFDRWPGLAEAVRYWYPECDYDEGHHLPFVGKEEQVIEMTRRDGQCIVRHIHQTDMSRVPMSGIPYQFQLLQIDHLPHWYSMPLDDGGYIHGGRQFDRYGRLLYYWLFPVHPSDFMSQLGQRKWPIPVRVNASEITVVREIGEPGSAFTSPPMRTGGLPIRAAQEHLDTEAIRLRQLASTGLLVSAPGYSDDDEQFEGMFGGGDRDAGGPGAPSEIREEVEPMEPGGIVKVPPGWKVEQTQPGDVGPVFGEFMRKQDTRGALGAGVPYGRFADDYGSYSSDRIAKIADRDFDVRMSRWRNQVLIAQFIRPVVKRLAIAAYLSGRWKPEPGTDMRQVYSCDMHLPRRDNVHQLQGEQAEDLAVAAGREAADDVAARRGKSGASVDMANAIAIERKRLLGIPTKNATTGEMMLVPPPPDTPFAAMITKMASEQIQRELQASQGGGRVNTPPPVAEQLVDDDMPTDTFDDQPTATEDGLYISGPVGTFVPS